MQPVEVSRNSTGKAFWTKAQLAALVQSYSNEDN